MNPKGRWAMAGVIVVAAAGLAGFAWGTRPSADRLAAEARQAWQDHQPDRAEAILGRLERIRPLTVDEWMLRAQVAREAGDFDKALASLSHVPTDHPKASAIEHSRGLLELARGRAEAAATAWRLVIRHDPQNIDALRELVHVEAVRQRWPEMRDALAQWSRQASLGFDELSTWTAGSGATGDVANDVIELRRWVESDPNDTASRLALAECLRRLGDLPNAERELEGLRADDPRVIAARVRLALDRGDGPAAEELLAQASGDDAELDRLRGHLALARGDAETAAARFRSAQARQPDHRDTLAGLGQALKSAGNEAAAAPLLRAAYERDALESALRGARSPSRRDDPATLKDLAERCERLGMIGQARGWYKLVLTRDPLDSQAQTALHRLNANREKSDQSASSSGPSS